MPAEATETRSVCFLELVIRERLRERQPRLPAADGVGRAPDHARPVPGLGRMAGQRHPDLGSRVGGGNLHATNTPSRLRSWMWAYFRW